MLAMISLTYVISLSFVFVFCARNDHLPDCPESCLITKHLNLNNVSLLLRRGVFMDLTLCMF